MWILLLPLIVAEIVFWISIVFFGWCAFKAACKQNWLKTAFWLVLFTAPFIFYLIQHMHADEEEDARIRQVANFERIQITTAYPRQLDIHGYVTVFELLIYLDVLNIDEVVMFQSRARQNELRGQFITISPKCKGIGAKHLATWKRKGRFGSPSKKDKNCLVSRWQKVESDRSKIPALVFMQGRYTTLKQTGAVTFSSMYEARLRTSENDQLIDYWERPFIPRPAEPGPWGYAYPSNTDLKKYKQPKRLNFFLKAMNVL